ncbi:MAG: branched-chain amino acid aminotransferase [Candidatus Moranbacteria bacterium]|nr:branched-chain amino acid aminotransferase [Candidatus Moranbacteria bacterium]
MANIYGKAYFRDRVVPVKEANLSVASSSVLYGLSVYTVFPVTVNEGIPFAFRLRDHYARLVNSSRIIGLDTFEPDWTYERFLGAVSETVRANGIDKRVFVRATVHVDELLPGTRSRGLSTAFSMFLYEAAPILPEQGVRLKTSLWRRIPDYAIPSRAKVNGAYVNSVLAKQDALDAGYDDCIFLDTAGHVCELSAANIFMVRNGTLCTPDTGGDLLEGINRAVVIRAATEMGIPVAERMIDLTELYVADEVFASGTSAHIASVGEVDARRIGDSGVGPVTARIQSYYRDLFRNPEQGVAAGDFTRL